mmetsp:Transcript_15772/g.43095  ORF Transcript_15772/g.43095 Transcript_15772/m.43095 type:complete len:103 (+) Transcript_15772:94-402(+)|eukprot:CAMPEP_0117555900 /NCGR_PEP_ID=MMETSP0784-20121206/51517_1 /TAXON_ID=39447 /ORGANISM="" /LENGTH=102 /DNA_ID=CAMNT_0005353129 /DNA_START=88 /DNA_END=396 /DNA_ORIENTATION=+
MPVDADMKKQMQKPVVKYSDMMLEMRTEVVDFITGSIDKFAGADGINFEASARLIKETLDKQYGFNWHCAIGKGFSYDVTAQNGTLMYCFYQGELAIVVFKC